MSHERPWENVDSTGIEFGEVLKSPTVDLGSPWDGADGQIAELHLSVGEGAELSNRKRAIVIEDPVWQRMIMHSMKQPNVEVGGFLLGSVWQELTESSSTASSSTATKGAYTEGVWIQDLIQAEFQESSAASLRFTHETWQAVARKHQASESPLAIVGWYHTHPNWGIFLSSMDEFICQNFFSDHQSVALVIDPQRKLAGCFEWDDAGKKMVKRSSVHLRVSQELAILRHEAKLESTHGFV